MKQKWDSKYFKIWLTAVLVIIAGLSFYYFLFYGKQLKSISGSMLSVLMPVLDGLIIAYLLAPIVNAIERYVLYPLIDKCNLPAGRNPKRAKKIVRGISMLLTFIIVLFFVYQFFALIIPQIVNSIQSIVVQFPGYISQLTTWVEKLLMDNPDMERMVLDMLDRYSATLQNWLNTKLLPQMNSIVMSLSLSVISILKGLGNLVIGLIISVYLLGSKEVFSAQVKKILYATFQRRTANIIIHDLRFTHRTFSGFISGKIVDSILIGILCFFCISAMNMPYSVLISVIVGVTNVIPFFGPYFGAVPSAFLILMIDPLKCLYFLIFILVLQQFDGNILGPKILGNSTGLSSFWVIFAITVFGGLWGVPGMIVGVPFFAVIYSGIRANVHRQLKRKALPIKTENYLHVGHISKDGSMKNDIYANPTKGKSGSSGGFRWQDVGDEEEQEGCNTKETDNHAHTVQKVSKESGKGEE